MFITSVGRIQNLSIEEQINIAADSTMNWQSFHLGGCSVFSQYQFVGFSQGNSVLVFHDKDDAKALVISRSFWNGFSTNISQYLWAFALILILFCSVYLFS